MLSIGTKAPDFELPDQDGNLVKLSDFRGRKVLLWFFPKASTPGCTAEGCSLRDTYSDFESRGIAILGMSKDSPVRQKNFAEKNGFTYPLLADESGSTVEAYEAWGRKKLYGREYDGILRISYLIDEDGRIEKAWGKVKTKTHGLDVLNELEDE